MRARFIFEKFTEDSDPIMDMGIGMLAKLNKLKSKYPKIKWETAEAKDYRRIRDLVSKSKGNPEKERIYARNMAKAITDSHKAYRRYLAAKYQNGEDWDVTNIFLVRALELFGIQ